MLGNESAKLIEECKGKSVAIYGAGVYGKRVLDCLLVEGISVIGFIVSNKAGDSVDTIKGIPLFTLDEISESYFKNVLILISMDKKNFPDVKKKLRERFGESEKGNIIYLSHDAICALNRDCHPVKAERFLNSTKPISILYGHDRGTPVDRYYIEKFLFEESIKINNAGLVLEVGEDTYSKKYFPNSVHEILYYSAGMDLTVEGSIPQNRYDVFICTQVFHQIFDVRKAIAGARSLLKKGGVMLATVCGTIVKPAKNDEYEHYWGFTVPCISNLMQEMFQEQVITRSYGNVAAATAFIQGVAAEELSINILDEYDPDYPVCISIVAKKL